MATRKRKRKKNPAAVELGKRGGWKRVKNQTPEERSESARWAITERWRKDRERRAAKEGTA